MCMTGLFSNLLAKGMIVFFFWGGGSRIVISYYNRNPETKKGKTVYQLKSLLVPQYPP